MEVARGTKEAERSGQAFDAMLTQLSTVTMQVQQIAAAAEQQTVTTSEITNNIHQISVAIQQNSNGAQESVQATLLLNDLARNLNALMGQVEIAESKRPIRRRGIREHAYANSIDDSVQPTRAHPANWLDVASPQRASMTSVPGRAPALPHRPRRARLPGGPIAHEHAAAAPARRDDFTDDAEGDFLGRARAEVGAGRRHHARQRILVVAFVAQIIDH